MLSESQPVIVGIARGGVIVAAAVAQRLSAPLDVLVIRKVGHPLQPELALGAVSASGESVVTPYAHEIYRGDLEPLFAQQRERARALDAALRGAAAALALDGRVVVLVDDGIATSATMECAIAHARRAGASRIVCAAPVAPRESVETLRASCDALVVPLVVSERDFAVGRYYRDFREVPDAEVAEALEQFPR